MIYTFDIFDTLLSRETIEPVGVFYLMQEKLRHSRAIIDLSTDFCDKFVLFRLDAETQARNIAKRADLEEVTLEKIYDCLMFLNALTIKQKDFIMSMEIECEYAISIPVEENIEKIRSLIDSNTVFLITDMYLSSNLIRKLLLKHDSIFNDMPILVSSELGKTKRTGSLYDYFIDKYKIDVTQWIHCGDNDQADGEEVTKRNGSCSIYVPGKITEREKSLLKVLNRNSSSQMFLGKLKNACRTSTNEAIAYRVGVEYTTPIFYEYICWVLKEAQILDIKTLVFIARDGNVLKKIADYIIDKEGLEIQTKYLYGSRWAWRIPAVATDKDSLKLWFSKECVFESVYELTKIFSISYEKIINYLPTSSFYGNKLTQYEVICIKEILLEQEEFCPIL